MFKQEETNTSKITLKCAKSFTTTNLASQVVCTDHLVAPFVRQEIAPLNCNLIVIRDGSEFRYVPLSFFNLTGEPGIVGK